MDRRPGAGADVDAGVQPAPAVAVLGGDAARDRPRAAAASDAAADGPLARGRGALADDARERRLGGRLRVDLAEDLLLASRQRGLDLVLAGAIALQLL
jgi:hypothetical protein